METFVYQGTGTQLVARKASLFIVSSRKIEVDSSKIKAI